MMRRYSLAELVLCAVIATVGLSSCGGGSDGSGPEVIIRPPGNQPDLTVTNLSVSETSPNVGQVVTVRATVRNQGAARSAATTLRWVSSTDATISTTDDEEGTSSVGGIAPSGFSNESFTLLIPLDTPPGTYYAGACVDRVSGESDTANNCSSAVRVTVRGGGTPPPSTEPDLVVGSPTVSDNSPDAGASFTLSATVRNGGDARSATTTLRYYRSSDATISASDTAVGTDLVASLSASGTSAESISLTAPSTAGTYYYGACVDTVSGESDTADNCSSAVRVTVSAGGGGDSFGVGTALPGVPTSGFFFPAVVSGASVSSSAGTTTITWNRGGHIQLQDGTRYTCQTAGGCAARNGVVTRGTIVHGGGTPPPSTEPDLAVGSPTVSDDSPDAGASFTLSATVRNGGDARSATTTLRYYRSSDATISASDTAVGTDLVASLSASGTSAESISLTAPSTAGTYYYGACVDTVSGESDTADNCSSAVRVTVSAGGGGDSFGVGTALPGVPTSGFFFPAVVSGASVSSSAGTTTITWNRGGHIQLQDGTRYTCQTAGGCAARNGVVTRGTIVRGGGTPPPSTEPDLAVGSPTVSDDSPDAGASFTLSATVRNGGDARSATTTLRYYRSSDATISASDTAVGTDLVASLSASGTSAESISLTAPSTAGTYYYGACVDTVSGESDTADNCSSAVRVTVSAGGGRSGECQVGGLYRPGESCDVYGVGSSSTLSFSVRADGRGRFAFFTSGSRISARNTTLNGVTYYFVASTQGGGVWRVDEYRR